MKYILIILSFFIFNAMSAEFNMSQKEKKYQWEQITQLEKEGKYDIAKKLVIDILKEAKNSNDYQNIYKALLYKMKYELINEEDAILKHILDLNNAEIAEPDNRMKTIYRLIQAEYYQGYYSSNQYQILNRTYSGDLPVDQFLEWSPDQFQNEINKKYWSTLEFEEAGELNISDWDIVHNQKYKFKPYTLFNLCSDKAFEYFQSNGNHGYGSNEKSKYYFDNPKMFGPNNEFVGLDLEFKDSLNRDFNALKILQVQLSKLKENDKSDRALEYTWKRINFLSNKSILADKESLVYESLKSSREFFSTRKDDLFNAYWAQYLLSENRKENKAEVIKEGFEDIIVICQGIIKSNKKGEAHRLVKEVLSSIEENRVELRSGQILLPNQSNILTLNTKNITELTYKIHSLSRADFTELERRNFQDNEKRISTINDHIQNAKIVKDGKWEISKPAYLEVESKVELPSLNPGYYVFDISNPNGNEDEKLYFCFLVSDIGLEELLSKKGREIRLFSRSTGAPLVNCEFKVHSVGYAGYRKEQLKHLGDFTSDNEGYILIGNGLKADRLRYEISYKDDEAILDAYGSYYYSNPPLENKTRSTILTDRAIYRPGQTVYFKVIVHENIDENIRVKSNEEVTVALKNVNYKEVDNIQLITNEFGSANGSFILPERGLTGNFTIDVSTQLGSSKRIKVEEYKRPKFQVKLDSLSQVFMLNDEVEINGTAISFNQVPLDNAKVKYTVKRKVQFRPYPWCYWISPRYSNFSEIIDIASGETNTNADGKFNLSFSAIPNLELEKDWYPTFNYEVKVDVLDTNGETRSSSQFFNFGYHKYNIDISGKGVLNEEENLSMAFNVRSINGEDLKEEQVRYKVYQLESPEKAPLYNTKDWEGLDIDLDYLGDQDFSWEKPL